MCHIIDDTQLFIPSRCKNRSAINQLMEMKTWITNNFLHLNDDKTHIVLFGPTEKTDLSTVDLGSFTPFRSFDVKDLGFILESGLKLNKQIIFFYHRRLAKVKPFVSRTF